MGDEEEDSEEEDADDDDQPQRKRKKPTESEDSDEDSDEEEEELTLFTEPFHIKDTRRSNEITDNFETIEDPEQLMEWLISPVDLPTFFESVFEQQPALITRPNNRDYYKGLLSREEIDLLLRTKNLEYQFNVDVTHYSRKGVRENFNYNSKKAPPTVNPSTNGGDCGGDGDSICEKEKDSKAEVADADVIWRRVANKGCSMRLLHPQRFSATLWRVLSKLEDFWRSPMGSNSYYTPAGCQGFAPHFDDIDAFILQLEGAKRWRLHAPTDPRNILPRYSSRDFSQEEVGEVVMDVVLQPGDLLYLPRGMVHQAESLPESHSLHLTISANSARDRTWQSLFEALLPRAITLAAAEHRELRASVPRELTMALGTAVLPVDGDEEGGGGGQSVAMMEREIAKISVTEYAKACLAGIMESVDFDWGADWFDTEFLMQRLPPAPKVFSKKDKNKAAGIGNAHGSGSSLKIRDTTRVQMIHPGAARLVIDADGEQPMALVVHSLSNQRDAHATVGGPCGVGDGEEIPSVVEFPYGCAETLAGLLTAVEEDGVAIGAVAEPENDDEEGGSGGGAVSSVDVAIALIKAGLLKVVPSAPPSKKKKY